MNETSKVVVVVEWNGMFRIVVTEMDVAVESIAEDKKILMTLLLQKHTYLKVPVHTYFEYYLMIVEKQQNKMITR